VRNTGSQPAEVYLMADDRTRAFGEIEGLAPGTTRTLSVTLAPGRYVWRCLPLGGDETWSEPGLVQGEAVAAADSYVPVTPAELDAAVTSYRAAVSGLLVPLQADVGVLRSAIDAGDLARARTAWLTAHLDYERLGAAYGTFGELDGAINGRSDGLAGGADDPDFTGFGRLEAELWAPGVTTPGPQAAETADRLVTDVDTLIATFPTLTTDPNDLPLRAHEILENSIQFELTGITDHGSHTNLATLSANVDGTRTVLDAVAPALAARDAATLADARTDLDALAALVASHRRADGSWTPLDQLSRADRQRLNGMTGHLVEVLAPVPDLLELPPSAPS
jgi:high-affinity iron transporter